MMLNLIQNFFGRKVPCIPVAFFPVVRTKAAVPDTKVGGFNVYVAVVKYLTIMSFSLHKTCQDNQQGEVGFFPEQNSFFEGNSFSGAYFFRRRLHFSRQFLQKEKQGFRAGYWHIQAVAVHPMFFPADARYRPAQGKQA